ncbi:hypothetical protein QE392_001104 [Microbacterium proteolyticum]|uniref:hypothetical protein n=1 Tax=Microbacterium proteolyticum TaxID=1572644 RepID=UPI00277DF583|nr:hypothetical protein [Microbacterium proteolyticum]MDQ1169300.1 hypothetical protein [Microbacterium proteolyticum]
MPSPIDFEKIPGADIQPDAIEENARTIGTISGQVTEHGSNVNFTWQGMAGVYEAPESPTLLGLMAPVSSQATQVGDNLAEVSAALIAFAADVRPIKAELDSLRIEAKAFVDSIQGGVQVREINPAWTAAQSPYGGATATPTYQGSWGGSTTTTTTAPATPRQVPHGHEGVARVPGACRPQQRAAGRGERTADQTVGGRTRLRQPHPRPVRC